MKRTILAMIAWLVLLAMGQAEAAIINLATGLDASDNLITTGNTPDSHWTNGGNPAKVVASNNNGWYWGWVANGPNSSWIAINPNSAYGNSQGTYSRTFDLTGYNLSTVSIAGDWTLDDQGVLELNGHVLANLYDGDWVSLHAFSVAVGSPYFLPGLNTLSIRSTWTDNLWEGVRLEGALVGERAPSVPEPTTLIIWSLLGGLAVGLGWWRKRKAA
jgi:hypothetical protein